MPSFDVVSDVDLQEVDNAINQVQKEIAQRFDFRGGKSSVTFDRAGKKIAIVADDELKLRSIHQILEQKFVKRAVDLRCLDYGKEEPASGQVLKQTVTLKAGIDREEARKITQSIKSSGLKVQAQIQDEQVRVTGKKIDDLQAVIRHLKAGQFGLPLQFVNMRDS